MTASELVAVDGGDKITVALRTEATQAHNDLLEARRTCEVAYMEMAKALYYIGENRLFAAIGPGYTSFDDYINAEMDFSPRKAKYLTSVWWWFGVENGANPKMMSLAQDIGWSKAKELVNVVDDKNIDAWDEMARGMSRRELKVAVKAAFNEERERNHGVVAAEGREMVIPDGSNADEASSDAAPEPVVGVKPPSPEAIRQVKEEHAEAGWVRFSVNLTKEMNETVKEALKVAGEMAASDKDGNCMSLICLHYLSQYAKPKAMTGDMLSRIEIATGMKLVAVKGSEIVFGEDTVNALAGDPAS